MTLIKLEQVQRTRADGAADSSIHVEADEAKRSHPSAMTAEMTWVTQVRSELDGYLCTLKTLNSMPPDEVFSHLSGITARLVEIRLVTHRTESRRLNSLRTHEIDPMLDQCDRAFRIHSRIQATRQMEWDQLRGIT